MVVVFVLVGWIGLRAGLSLMSTHAAANQELELVSSLSKSNHRLEAQIKALNQPATIITDARSLGMVRGGERSYSVVGLPGGN